VLTGLTVILIVNKTGSVCINVILTRVSVTIVAMQKQEALRIFRMCQ